jgi:hypothetical protein
MADPADIGSKPVQVVLVVPQKDNAPSDSANWLHLNLSNDVNLICAVAKDACPQLQQVAKSPLLSTPSVQAFDTAWSGTKDKNGKTMLDRNCDTAKQQVLDTVSGKIGETAYNIICNFPATGSLGASTGQLFNEYDCSPSNYVGNCGSFVPGLTLSYHLSGLAVSFAVPLPNTCDGNVGDAILNFFGGGEGCVTYATAPDPKFTVDFDVEVDVHILMPSSTEPCTMTVRDAQMIPQNSNIIANNTTADFAKVIGGFSAPPIPGDTIDPDSLGIGSALGQLNQACSQAVQQGFSQFSINPDPVNGLTLVLTHPLDQTHITNNDPAPATPPGTPQLSFSPTIDATPASVAAKGGVTVTGEYFPSSNVSQVHLRWNDPTDEQLALKESDIEWGPQGNLSQVTKQRTAEDAGSDFMASNLKPGTKYEFKVRDCDNVTCSRWSDPLYVTTGSTPANQVTIYMDSVAPVNALGTASPDLSGGFTQAVQLPATVASGKHSLIAVGPGSVQSKPVQITVLAANQTASPELDILGQAGANGPQSALQTYPFTVQGSAFTANGMVSLYLDKATGQPLATATVGSNGSFQATLTLQAAGSHSVIAVESLSGQSIQATLNLAVVELPK